MRSVISIYRHLLLSFAAATNLASAAGERLFNEKLSTLSDAEIDCLVSEAVRTCSTFAGFVRLHGRVLALSIVLLPLFVAAPILAILAKNRHAIAKPDQQTAFRASSAVVWILVSIVVLHSFMK